MYLYTHGTASSVQSSSRKYIQGGKTIPLPLKVVKHYGKACVKTQHLKQSTQHFKQARNIKNSKLVQGIISGKSQAQSVHFLSPEAVLLAQKC
jgi:hypothetical protein